MSNNSSDYAKSFDNGEYDHQRGVDVEDNTDPEGVETRAKVRVLEPQVAPSFIEKDFEFRRGNKDATVAELMANGRRAYFLQPRTAIVDRTIKDAEGALAAASSAFKEEDSSAAEALAGEMKDLGYTLAGLDQWLGDLIPRAVARQAASDATFIARGAATLDGWDATTDDAITRKDSFESMLFSAQRRLGVLLTALRTLDAEKHINVKAAAWQRMQAEARKYQQKYLHADEYHVVKTLRGEHSKEAQRASTSLLLRRAS